MPRFEDELKAVQAEIDTTREKRAEAITQRDAHKGAIEASDQPLDRNSDTFKSARAAAKDAGELGDKLSDLQASESELLMMLGRADEAQAKREDRENGV